MLDGPATVRTVVRGRDAGAIPRLIEDEFRRLGAPPDCLEHAATEMAAVRSALAWSRPGDLLILISHSERERVLDLLESLEGDGWQPGAPLPGTS